MADDYSFAGKGPSRIRLKETPAERTQRLYDRERRRDAKTQSRISRANGYAVTPPRSGGQDGSMSPPRRRARSPSIVPLDQDETGEYKWMGDQARHARSHAEEQERQERLRWQMQEELARSAGDPFPAYYPERAEDGAGQRIPSRHRSAASGPSSANKRMTAGLRSELHSPSLIDERRRRRSDLPPPNLNQMTDAEYTAYIRAEMDTQRQRADVRSERERAEARARKKREAEAAELRAEEADEAKRAAERKQERKRRQEAETKRREDEGKKEQEIVQGRKEERERWRARWEALSGSGAASTKSRAAVVTAGRDDDGIEETELQWLDVPWPAYKINGRPVKLDDLDKERIKAFLQALAADSATTVQAGPEAYKKTLREAIRMYHPDRFFGRVLPRVRESEREQVKEGVGRCSRIINDLAAELRL